MIDRTRYVALALATLIASPLGCANGGEVSAAPEPGHQTRAPARGDTTTPTTDTEPVSAADAEPVSALDDKPISTASDDSAANEMPTPTADETANPTSGGIDPTGVWWTEVMTVGSEVLPILDKLTGANIRFVMRVDVSGEAPNNNVTFAFCQLQTEWIDPMDANNITTIGFRPDTVAAFSETIVVDLGDLSTGSKVPLPSLTFRGGMDASGMELDEDGDGNPAVTAWVRTLAGIEIEVYETITINASLDLTVPDENTLTGTVDFRADAEILSSNNVIIAAGTAVTITPDSKTVPLTAKRLSDGGDCTAFPSTIKFTTVPPPPPVIIPPPEPLP